MTALSRVRVSLLGFPGAPGVMTFACTNPDAFIVPLNAWIVRIRNFVPNIVSMQVESSGDVFESTTGQISGTWARGVQPVVTGLATGAYAAPAGGVCEWLTDIHLSGRRLRGRTFVVPMATNAFDLGGSIEAAALLELRAASAEFVTGSAGSFNIWQRPRLARAANGTFPAVAARGGGNGVVTSSRVPDKAVVLRSRRD